MSTNTFVDVLVERITVPLSSRLCIDFRTAAKLTGLGESSLRKMARTGKLASKKIGARRVIKMTDLEQFVR